jgi:hypothetical protein
MVKFTRMLNQLLGMETALSMAYHPQMDGQTEWLNQKLEQYLQLYVNHILTDWVDWLPITEFAYNNHEHSVTGYSPFFLEYGHHPFVPMAPWKSSIDNSMAKEFVETLSWARQHT